MSVSRKIALLGAGSLYFPHAIPDILLSEELAGSEMVMYDLDTEKAERMAAMARRLAESAGTRFSVKAAGSLPEALDGADFAVTSIGGSGAEVSRNVYSSYFHLADVRICAQYGVQQLVGDTCGPAGMMMALRSIPAYLDICREMERLCPKAILINHSNPMAALCRAMRKYSNIQVIGLCHGVQGGIVYAAGLLGVPPEELCCTWVGTNHYYWYTRVTHRGEDVYPALMERVAAATDRPKEQLSRALSLIYGHQIVYPEDDHIIEFYPFLTQVPEGPQALPYHLPEAAKAFGNDPAQPDPAHEPPAPELRAEFFRHYQEILDRRELPAKQDDSITGEGLGALIGAIANGRRHLCIANLANQGAIPNLPATAEVEVEAVTDYCGIRPLHMGDAPLILKGILEKRFVWQELVADAAATGSRKAALQAMMVDEMAIWPEKAEALLDALLSASQSLLPQFE
ncbi:MAG: hypothetical protein IT210_24310 [Armatimonadetes bacterium]|nr:hypothetical protein [Armatimonadota bacterium]